MSQELNFERASESETAAAMAALVRPAGGYVGFVDALSAALALREDALVDQRSLPLGQRGQELLGLRYLIANGHTWFRFVTWRSALTRLAEDAPARVHALFGRLERLAERRPSREELERRLEGLTLSRLAAELAADLHSDATLGLLDGLHAYDALRGALRARLEREARDLVARDPEAADWLYLLTHDLHRQPATTVGGGRLRYVIVADKGEMGVRAVREAVAFGALPVALFSQADDAGALAVREAEAAGGFAIPLAGTFRESYASPLQIVERIKQVYAERFGHEARARLAESALYPGYGPLAENSVAIQHFRRSGLSFVGPMQDVVERAGDKRKFRQLAESIDPAAVTPGIVMASSDPEQIAAAIAEGHQAGKFTFPGRLKAANGGGGRGQVVIPAPDGVPAAVTKVLADIEANGWDAGVMFEQNIPETTHLEVQVLRDRFGNTRHFGMRDCTEQRASQKIQEEAPPALLRAQPELERKMCEIAVRIADDVGYVGACTVELMYKDGRFYLLEMNTRIQVEHPVTEEAHRIRRGDRLEKLNLVRLQLEVAAGRPLDFAQADVVQTRVAREFRINAESFKPGVKDPRDGRLGLFLPNGGVFDVIELPSEEPVVGQLRAAGVEGIAAVGIRFDCGFEPGDELVNKDPTFGKLLVSVEPEPAHVGRQYELLRRASLEVLRAVRIEGRQLTPSGKVLHGHPFETNVGAHIQVLEAETLVRHSNGGAPRRHVGWVLEYLRGGAA